MKKKSLVNLQPTTKITSMKLHAEHQTGTVHFMRTTIASSLIVGCMAFSSAAQATGITFEFDYSGNTAGVGFLDPTYGSARQAALNTAGTMFASMFGNYFSNSGTIQFAITSTDDPNSNTLASAGSEIVVHGTGGFGSTDVIMSKLQTGVDRNGNSADGVVDVNWGWDWELDPFETPDSSYEFDFYAAMFHEFTHAIGFVAGLDKDGRPIYGSRTGGDGEWGPFAEFLADKDGTWFVDNQYVLDKDLWNDAVVGGTGDGVYFYGPNAMAANGGNPVELYSPDSYEEGSSTSHLDKAIFPDDMMKHDRDFGTEARDYSSVVVGMLTDIGYTRNTTTPVPVPATGSLMIMGIGALALVARRRRA